MKYYYFVSYSWIDAVRGMGFGSISLLRKEPITDYEHIRDAAVNIALTYQLPVNSVVVLNFILLRTEPA